MSRRSSCRSRPCLVLAAGVRSQSANCFSSSATSSADVPAVGELLLRSVVWVLLLRPAE
ncbi:hypothetical protein [Streptomyces sp. PA5.6]|uniref:hypothetical protein n=1 Tax=Streptomyces sp. PA5.6 TaxID=3035651 RepID=UPI0039048F28